MWFPSIRALCSLSAAFLFFLLTWSSTPAYSASSGKDGINDGPYKVLIALPLGSKSHKNIFWPLAMGLAGRGHQVTLISAHKPYKQVKGITEITLDGLYAPLDKAAQGMWTMEKERFGKAKLIKGVMDAAVDTCNKTLSHWALKPIFEGARSGTSHFDLVIASAFFNECSFPFAQIYQAPLILVSIVGLLPWLSQSSGFRDITSFMTSPMSAEASDKLSFMSRMVTTIEYMASPLALKLYYWPQIDALVEAKFANDIASGKNKLLPPMSEKEWGKRKAMLKSEAMLGSTSMVFINTHVASEGVRPLLPSVVEVGGMHCVPANPLPKDLEKWVSSSEDGFVLFSLGSVVTPDKLSDAHRQAFIKAFKQFPRLNFLWKWSSDSMDGLPPNVKVSTWLPQQDLLGHRKIKAFITHGGLLSTQESIYHGVPVIGIPVGADQQNNMQRAVNEGVGLRLSWETLSTDAIVNALKTVIMEPRFKENLLTRAAVFKDQPESPLQRAVFWTEYVVRHHGAPHLSSGSKDLYWWQFYLLDVWATILAAIFVPIWISMKITSAIFRMIFPGDKAESPKASGQGGKAAKKDSGAKKPKKSTKQE